ncbi:hypothetical protein ACFTZI_07430 [Streptomyces decoyicus]|uniref:hypothetical protein n=1 Tax=Streptomyces decoyicus TaxID=249567 RepID=UPI00362962A9
MRDDYERTKFEHWIDEDKDGNNTQGRSLLPAMLGRGPTLDVPPGERAPSSYGHRPPKFPSRTAD